MSEWLCGCVCARAHVHTYVCVVCRDTIDLGLDDCRNVIDFYRKIEDN